MVVAVGLKPYKNVGMAAKGIVLVLVAQSVVVVSFVGAKLYIKLVVGTIGVS